MFKGLYTALLTPFADDGSLDEDALRRLVEDQIAGGVDGLVPMGTTGESPTVTHGENMEVIRIVIDQARGRTPVIAGTGSNSTAEAIDMSIKAKDIGADATLQVVPYYNRPNQEGFYRHFHAIAEQSQLPLLIYNIPGRTAQNLHAETILRLAAHPLVVGVKEASGSIAQVMDILSGSDEDFCVLSGDDNTTLPLMSVGAQGVVSVASNLIPEKMKNLVEYMNSGKLNEARTLHYTLLPLFKALFLDTNPMPVKFAWSKMKHRSAHYRLPLCLPSDEIQAKIVAILKKMNIIG